MGEAMKRFFKYIILALVVACVVAVFVWRNFVLIPNQGTLPSTAYSRYLENLVTSSSENFSLHVKIPEGGCFVFESSGEMLRNGDVVGQDDIKVMQLMQEFSRVGLFKASHQILEFKLEKIFSASDQEDVYDLFKSNSFLIVNLYHNDELVYFFRYPRISEVYGKVQVAEAEIMDAVVIKTIDAMNKYNGWRSL